jgi:hypothetical protein
MRPPACLGPPLVATLIFAKSLTEKGRGSSVPARRWTSDEGLSFGASLTKDDAQWHFAKRDIELSQMDEQIGRSPIEPVAGISL